jgi:hypothetical protein
MISVVGGSNSVPLEYVLTPWPDTQASHDAPRFHHDDQLRQQPELVADSTTTLRINSLFMARLSKAQERFPTL